MSIDLPFDTRRLPAAMLAKIQVLQPRWWTRIQPACGLLLSAASADDVSFHSLFQYVRRLRTAYHAGQARFNEHQLLLQSLGSAVLLLHWHCTLLILVKLSGKHVRPTIARQSAMAKACVG